MQIFRVVAESESECFDFSVSCSSSNGSGSPQLTSHSAGAGRSVGGRGRSAGGGRIPSAGGRRVEDDKEKCSRSRHRSSRRVIKILDPSMLKYLTHKLQTHTLDDDTKVSGTRRHHLPTV